ncbi:MAG: pyridoxal phosphate-dependent aminotransferase family protein [Actinobacteria bacterium]|nr:pyridoxal phosphate-dependent aminotransferase family protein [Actinomycetota bacterium]
MRATGLTNRVIEDEAFQGDTMILDGRKLINFGLCSYLSLGDDPRLKEAAKAAIDRYGTAYSSSINYSALPLYQELRQLLSTVFDAEVVLTGTTTLAHLAALPVLVGSADLVLIDTQSHSSVATATGGLIAAGVEVVPLPHNDMGALERTVAGTDSSRRIWYLTDGVFSMLGDTSPAEVIERLMASHPNLHVYCDDAHGFGWVGANGRGQFLNRAEWSDRLVVAVGLSKAFGSLGGAIATTNEEFSDRIALCGPTLMFGGPIPPPSMGASIAAAEFLLGEELSERQEALMDRIRLVNRLSEEIGLPLAAMEETPLWFHQVGSIDNMVELLLAMSDAGYFLNAAGFPVVPHGQAGLRFTVTLDLSLDQIEGMLVCLNEKRLEMFGESEVVIDLEKAADPVERPSS